MKRWLPFAVIVFAGLAAVFLAEHQRIDTRPSTTAILSATSDAQHELSRIPAHFDRLSDDEEIRIGDQLAASYADRWKPKAEDRQAAQQIEAYLNQVGSSVAAHARRKLPYRFHYIPDADFINAFALPGGHVFVGKGLLLLMQSEDALAAVLGHEVEHIDLRHCAERLQLEAQLHHAGVLGDLVGLPVSFFVVGYSRQQELEADRSGTLLAIDAGYSARGILQLLDEFSRLEQKDAQNEHASQHPVSPVDEAAQLSVQTLEDYFRSHPPAEQRKQQIEKLVASQPASPRIIPLISLRYKDLLKPTKQP